MLDFSIYLLYRAGSATLSALPLTLLFRLGRVLGFAGWLLLGKYRRLARRNLEIAFKDEKSSREIGSLVRRHFQRLGANLLCSVKMGVMPLDDVAKCVVVEDIEPVRDALKAGRSIALVLSHLGSWELFAQLFPRYAPFGRHATIYQKLGNDYIDRHVREKRGRAGVELFDRREGFQKPIQLLREGGLIGILSDQHAGDHGLWTPFFGRLASTSPLAGLLAKRTDAEVFAAALYTEAPGRWRMVFSSRLDSAGDTVQSITAKANATLEQQIRRAPEDWFWVHNRWKTPNPNFLLSHYRRGVYVSPGSLLKQFRILVRAPNWLGDSVMTIPAIRAIKAGRPDAHITVVASDTVSEIWRLVGEVDQVLPVKQTSLSGVVRSIRTQETFDAAIVFPNSLRAALEIWLARIPRRVGFAGHHRRWLLNEIIPEPTKRGPVEHQSKRYLQIARILGANVAPFNVFEPSASHTLANGNALKIGLCPGAEYGPAKRWLPERFAEVASAISAHSGAQWILFGTKGEVEIGEKIATVLGDHCVNRIGKTTLAELISEIRECRLLLTNDTGTMHLAALLDVPVVAVFGSTEPRLTGPLGNCHRVLRHQVECSPCFLRECPIDFRCMNAVSADEVTDAVLAQISASSQS